jgi:outer membrane murein-binding lipoprotein Lpp
VPGASPLPQRAGDDDAPLPAVSDALPTPLDGAANGESPAATRHEVAQLMTVVMDLASQMASLRNEVGELRTDRRDAERDARTAVS